MSRVRMLVCVLAGLLAVGGGIPREPVGKAYVYKKVDGRQLKLYVVTPPDWKAR